MGEDQFQLKLMTKRDFDSMKSKFEEIKDEANKVIEQAINPLDVLALKVKEGSGFSVIDARIINEENEENFLEIMKEGTEF